MTFYYKNSSLPYSYNNLIPESDISLRSNPFLRAISAIHAQSYHWQHLKAFTNSISRTGNIQNECEGNESFSSFDTNTIVVSMRGVTEL
jgi:hypothetical protein